MNVKPIGPSGIYSNKRTSGNAGTEYLSFTLARSSSGWYRVFLRLNANFGPTDTALHEVKVTLGGNDIMRNVGIGREGVTLEFIWNEPPATVRILAENTVGDSFTVYALAIVTPICAVGAE